MRTLRIGVLIFVFSISPLAHASEIYTNYSSIRGEGMGGAEIAVVDDETALAINPSGLGKIRGPYFSLANALLESNYDTQSAFSVGGNYLSITNPQNLLGVAKANPDKHLHTLLESLPSFVTTNFGIGVLGKYSVDAQFNSITQKMHIDYFNDYAALLGYCFRFWEGRLKVGVTGKMINRVYMNQDIAATAQNLSMGSLVSEGTGAGWDGSIMLTAPWTYLPTLTAVAHDIGNTYFNLGGGYFYKPGGPPPPPQEQSVDVGFGLFPIISHTTRMSISFEYRDVANPESVDVFRRLHAGAELNFGDTLFLRAGMNEHYYTAGLEFDFAHSQLQFATYGEDIGTPTSPMEDRRFSVEYGFRF